MRVLSEHPSILVLGGTKTGKTHYAGQLLGRLQRGQGMLKMIGMPSDMTVFQEVLDALSQGKSATHTPRHIYHESIWRTYLDYTKSEFDLIWPDYGGEQVERLTDRRQVPEAWASRIQSSGGWLLFIRPGTIRPTDDILNRPRPIEQMLRTNEAAGHRESGILSVNSNIPEDQQAVVSPMPRQIQLIELLQTLLFVRGETLEKKLHRPPLTIVLSCWDEMIPGGSETSIERASDILSRRLPLFSQFVEANWDPQAFEIIGLSALGKALKSTESDLEFIKDGPERQGYCILSDGRVSRDLTAPIARLMERMS